MTQVYALRRKVTTFFFGCLLLLLLPSCSLALFSWTDARPEKFEQYTKAWLGKEELILSYKTDYDSYWIQYSLKTEEFHVQNGAPPIESLKNKEPISIIVEKENLSKSTESFHPQNAILVKDVHKHQLYLEENDTKLEYPLPKKNFVLVNFLGYVEEDIHISIPSPEMKEYRPWWSYPAIIGAYPVTLTFDTATAPIWITVLLVGDRTGLFED